MISLMLIVLAIGAFFLLKKNLFQKFPQCKNAKVGALVGVPLFYLYASLTEVVRLWGASDNIFNLNGLTNSLKGTDPDLAVDIIAGSYNSMSSERQQAWAMTSLAENLSQFLALAVAVLCALLLYKLFNPESMQKLKSKTWVLMSGVCCVIPYFLTAIAGGEFYLWLILLVYAAVIGWTYLMYQRALLRLPDMSTPQSIIQAIENSPNDTKQCPYCGETILAVAKKCKHCGEWLPEEKVEETVEIKYIECPICGEDVEEGTTTCPHCNEPIAQ